MAKVKYAIIGFGGIAENRIAKEGFGCDKSRFNGLPNAELVGATDVNPARKAAAEALNLKWYDSIDAIIADKEIDAVYIATNNASHASIALKAMEAGKHVMAEKPLATTVADGSAMVKMAAKKKLSLTIDHMMVYNAFNQLARKYVAAGKLGNVGDSCFHMEFLFGATPEEAATWRCSKIEEMGGPIGDVASHCVSQNITIFLLIVEPLVELTCGCDLYPTGSIGGIERFCGCSFCSFCRSFSLGSFGLRCIDCRDQGQNHDHGQQQAQELFGCACHMIASLKYIPFRGRFPGSKPGKSIHEIL